jgi:hypothetical protein
MQVGQQLQRYDHFLLHSLRLLLLLFEVTVIWLWQLIFIIVFEWIEMKKASDDRWPSVLAPQS